MGPDPCNRPKGRQKAARVHTSKEVTSYHFKIQIQIRVFLATFRISNNLIEL
jgi:hypothetical protein